MKAKKSLGQHFLKSEAALTKIVDAAEPVADDVIVEIGPGTGVLTERLLFFTGKVIAIEKDRELIPFLREKFTTQIAAGKLDLIEKDILAFDPNVLSFYKGHTYKLVANIPYYITGAIFEQFLSARYQPETMVLLIQKEVAERIIARDKKESILSLSVKAYGTPKLVAIVPRGAFAPAPKVDSAILSIKTISRSFFADITEDFFFAVIKAAFGQKRKMIGNTLTQKYGSIVIEVLTETDISPKARPEDLTLLDWKKICLALQTRVL